MPRDYQLGEVILERINQEILFETIENIFNDVTYQELHRKYGEIHKNKCSSKNCGRN